MSAKKSSPRSIKSNPNFAANYEADTVASERQQGQAADVPMITISEHEYNWLKSCEKLVHKFSANNYAASEEQRKKPLLQRANELIGGDRQRDYGNKLQNFSQIAMLWQGTLATKLQASAQITAEDVALCMMQVKIARLAKSPDHQDSILDIAGYAGCYEAVQLERATGMPREGAIVDARSHERY